MYSFIITIVSTSFMFIDEITNTILGSLCYFFAVKLLNLL